jgi:hypothetical protein
VLPLLSEGTHIHINLKERKKERRKKGRKEGRKEERKSKVVVPKI